MSITAELAQKIQAAIDARGGEVDNDVLNAVAEELQIEDDQIVAFMFGDVDEKEVLYSDPIPLEEQDFIKSDTDSMGDAITSETADEYFQKKAEEEHAEYLRKVASGEIVEEDEDNFEMDFGMPPMHQPQTQTPNSADPLAQIMADMAAMGGGSSNSNDEVDEEDREYREEMGDLESYEYDNDGELIAPEDPTQYVFDVCQDGSDTIYSIFLKSFWDKHGHMDDREVCPEFLENAGFTCESESQWMNVSMTQAQAEKVLLNLGLVRIQL